MSPPALELVGIEKRFGPVQALRGADFTLARGQVHALLGENGAGKTTLMHVAYGLVRPDAGAIRVNGREVIPRSPREARRLGIGMVHQHFTAIPALTVAENIALTAGWPVRRRELNARVQRLVDRVGFPLDPDVPAGALGVALRQRLEILKALAADTTILLLDEPTGVLAPPEVEELFQVVRAFADAGGAVLLITHKLDEALRATDWVTVLRRGTVTLSAPTTTQSRASLAAAMLGGEMGADTEAGAGAGALAAAPGILPTAGMASGRIPPSAPPRVPILVRAEHLAVPREGGRGLAVRDASLAIHAGELLGVAAIEGNGQRELLRAIAGLMRPARGTLEVAEPIALIPEDRTSEGLVPELSLTANVVLGEAARGPEAHQNWGTRFGIDWDAARALTERLLREYEIQAPSTEVPAASLSGGNQQRLVIARALERRPRVVVAETPTRGLDIRATEAVWRRLRGAARAGAAVVVYSSDLDEVLEQADRIVVVADGVVRPAPAGAGRQEVGALMLGIGGRQP